MYRPNNNRRSARPSRSFGRKQSVFDPTALVLQSNQAGPSIVEPEAPYENQYLFADFAIDPQIKANLQRKGYTKPTQIQDQIIPAILEGRDAVGIANTGTGKTAAFLIPAIQKVLTQPDTRVLVIAPTRELAVQIREELFTFSQQLPIVSALCIGGSSLSRQIDQLRRRPHFVIGTPGRLKDLNQQGKLRFDQFNTIILDEVDRMLDMGFVNEVREIIRQLSSNRQSLFFSATINHKVEDIMRGFLRDPISVSIKSNQQSITIAQDVIRMEGRNKMDVLHELLEKSEFQKVLVFGGTKHGAERINRTLMTRGFKVASIHGNKTQGQRQRALQDFRNNYVQVLIATDVVARGLDIKDVTHVINYDLPQTYEDYIHRIGRTGRAEQLGVAITFVE